MKTKIYFVLLTCSLIGFQLLAQNISIIEVDKQSMLLEFQLEDYELSQLIVDNEILDIITAQECAFFDVKGEPALPFYAKSIMIPDLVEPIIEITYIAYKEIKVNKIIPSRGPLPRGVIAENIHLEFGKIYLQDNWYPESNASFGEPYILRDYNGVVLYLSPFQYNPKQQILKIAHSITVKVTYNNNKGFNLPKTLAHEFQNIYKNHFINYSLCELKYTPISDVGDMIIITTSEYMEAVEPLVTWKNRKGIPTTCYQYPDETGSTAEDIKNFIQGIYDLSGTLSFILIVGDAEDVPPAQGYIGFPSGYDADPLYTLLAGDDQYPDAFIGRFSVSSSEEASTVINKNLWYEMSPDPSGEWYHKATGIASDDQFTPCPADTVIAENICQLMLGHNYTHVDQFYDPGATSIELIDVIEEGRGFVNYIGHGLSTTWLTTGMNNTHVSQLTNSYKTPVIISTACDVGAFSNQTCFAEMWQRQGGTAPQGAVAFMGCSTTQWGVAGLAHPEMIDLLVAEEHFTLGGIFTNGVMAAIDYYPGTYNGGGPQCFQSWLLFGDPSLSVYTNTPSEMMVDFPGNLSVEDTIISITVINSSTPPVSALPDALVALYMNDSLLGSCYTNESGIAEITLDESIQQAELLELNVTARNKIPVFETIDVLTNRNEHSLPMNLSFFPNPCSGSINLYFEFSKKEFVKCDLWDLAGINHKTILIGEKMPGTHEMEIDMSDLPKGIYFLTLKTDDGMLTRKIIKL